MAKKSETPLKASERLKNFNPADFQVGTQIAFKHDGLWQSGTLSAVPEIDGRQIRIQTAGGEFRLNIPPKKVEINGGEQFQIGGKNYAVQDSNLGPDGELRYNLQNTADNSDLLRGIAQEFLLNLRRVTATETKRLSDTDALVAEIKNIKGAKREELTNKLQGLGKKAAEMRKLLGSLREWSKRDGDAIEATTTKIRELQVEIDEATRELELAVEEAIKKEYESGGNAAKRAIGEGVVSQYERELASKDAAARSVYEADPQGHKLEEPSKKQSEQEDVLLQLYREYEAVASGPAGGGAQMHAKQLKDEVDKRRREQAVRENKPGGDYADNSPEFELITAQKLREVMSEWRALKGDAAKFDFGQEKKSLEDKAKAIAEKLKSLNRSDLLVRLKNLRDGDMPTAVCIKSLDKSDDQVGGKIIDLMRQLNDLDLDADVAKPETAPPADAGVSAGEAEEAGMVDLPKEVVRELLWSDQSQVRIIMQEAFAALVGEGKQTADLEDSLKKFINGVNPDDNLRSRLTQFGIRDWAVFRDRFSQRIASSMAKVLLEMADSEMRMWLAQAPSDIAGRRVGVSESWQFSALAQMKGTVALRMAVNMTVLFGVGIGTAFATKLMIGTPGAASAGIVGGAVGLAKAGLQRFLGRDQSYFQTKAAEAKKAAEDKKRQFISEQLMQRMFDPAGQLQAGKDHELAHLFSIALRCATAEDADKELEVEDEESGETIRLTGEAVLIYHEALKRAAEDEGVDEEEKTKFAFAKAIHALHNNEAPDMQETPPLLARGLQWLTDAYSGRNVLKPGEQPAEILERGKPEETKVKETKVDFFKQAAITSALGASIAMAAVSESGAVRFGIGAAFGAAHGERAQHEKNRARADHESQTRLDTVLAQLEDSLVVARNNPTDLTEAGRITDYRNLLSALLAGTAVEAPLDHLDKKMAEYFRDHARDVGSFLQRNLKYRTLLTNAQREIARSGVLERAGFAHALQAAQVAGEKMKDEAQNSLGVRAGRWAKGKTRAVVYGAIGGGISYAVGQGIDAAKHAIGWGAPQPAGAEHQPGARAGEVEAGAVAAKPVEVPVEQPAEAPATSAEPAHEVAPLPPQEKIISDFTLTGEKGERSMYSAFDHLRHDEAGKEIFNGWSKKQFVEWRTAEMERLGYKFMEGGQIGHPYMLHPGAKVELYTGGDGQPYVRVLGVEEGKVEVLDKYRIETPGKGVGELPPSGKTPMRVTAETFAEQVNSHKKLPGVVMELPKEVEESLKFRHIETALAIGDSGLVEIGLDDGKHLLVHPIMDLEHNYYLYPMDHAPSAGQLFGPQTEAQSTTGSSGGVAGRSGALFGGAERQVSGGGATGGGPRWETSDIPVDKKGLTDLLTQKVVAGGGVGIREDVDLPIRDGTHIRADSVEPAELGAAEKTPVAEPVAGAKESVIPKTPLAEAGAIEISTPEAVANSSLAIDDIRDHFYGSDRGELDNANVMSGLAEDIKHLVEVDPSVLNLPIKSVGGDATIYDLLTLPTAQARPNETLALLTQTLADRLTLTPEQRLFLGHEFMAGGDFLSNVIITPSEGGEPIGTAVVAGGEGSSAMLIEFNDGHTELFSERDLKFFADPDTNVLMEKDLSTGDVTQVTI